MKLFAQPRVCFHHDQKATTVAPTREEHRDFNTERDIFLGRENETNLYAVPRRRT